ncbi:MAG: Holliday junction ATP-dependent DNA helicase RuvB [Candidatus Dojkabacteria bacterium]|nr:MAG: Holliday junction ATP-dependent DNA helicase RuvB [Candidatus Dojkabacteria bacterium]
MAIVFGKDVYKNQKQTNDTDHDNWGGNKDINSSNRNQDIIRVHKIDEIVGRHDIKAKLKTLINSSKSRGDVLEHLLFYGPPGLGKTTFGYAIANEIGTHFILTSGPTLTSKAEMASIITNLKEGDVLFIDEIHRLSKVLEEFLYPILEDFKMDIAIGKGSMTQIVQVKVPKFTLIGATTQIGLVSAPLRDRFGMTFKVDFFDVHDLSLIVTKYAKDLNIKIDEEAATEIARRSRGTARLAIRNLKRARDYALELRRDCISYEVVLHTFNNLDIDEYGLELVMRKYLYVLEKHFGGGPVGISNISSALYEDVRTIEDIYEPYLIKIGFLKRTVKGRVLTEKGREYISNLSSLYGLM